MRTKTSANSSTHLGAYLRSRPWWPHAKIGLTAVFFALIGWLLVEHARDIEWAEVGKALSRLPYTILFSAALLAAISFAVYATFDLIGRRYAQHTLSTPCVMLVAFISYAFNLNLGSLIGGVAFRYRLYAKYGLGNEVISRVLGLSMLTNWLGYCALGGIVLCFFTPDLPAQWTSKQLLLPWLGSAMLLLASAYLLACSLAKRRQWRWRSHTITLPTIRMALLQLALSTFNWMLMAGIVYTLLQARIDYPSVLMVLLLAAIAGVITHVPAGLGVFETVFVAMLSSRLPATQLLAALLAYRAVYYLLPLAFGALLYTRLEWQTATSSA